MPDLLVSRAPADGASMGEAPSSSPGQVLEAVAKVRAGQRAWERRGPVLRAAQLVELGRLITREAAPLAELLAHEVGKPLGEAKGEVARAAAICAYYGGIANDLGGDLRRSADPHVMVVARQVPIGVAGVITPWNFPLAIPAWKIVPALAAGCTVVWKPAPQAFVTATAWLDLAREAGIGDEVLAMVHGDAEAGAALAGAELDALSFTGSSRVGEKLRAAVADRPVRLTLELGGVNIAHVLPDADVPAAAADLIAAAYGFAGQKCTATQVIAVDHSVARELEQQLAARLEALSVGTPLMGGVVAGPVIDVGSADHLRNSIEALSKDHDAYRADAPTGGAWVTPTLIIGERDRLLREEFFGPVATLIVTDGLEDHAGLVAASPSALASAVYGRDTGALRQMINIAGTAVVAVNRPSTGLDPHVPFGGWGASAGGFSEQGQEALRAYSKWQTVYWRADAPGAEFP